METVVSILTERGAYLNISEAKLDVLGRKIEIKKGNLTAKMSYNSYGEIEKSVTGSVEKVLEHDEFSRVKNTKSFLKNSGTFAENVGYSVTNDRDSMKISNVSPQSIILLQSNPALVAPNTGSSPSTFSE